MTSPKERMAKGTKRGQHPTNQSAATFSPTLAAKRVKSVHFLMTNGIGISKQGRCWSCGSTQHMKPECPVKDVPKVKKEIGEDAKSKDGSAKGSDGGHGTQPGEALGGSHKEAVQLLKSLRPSVKALCMRSVNTTEANGRALLDGGATHVLRPARSKKEFEEAIPIKVELAAGVTTLRQVESTGTLITDFETQTIVLLGKVVRMGYKVRWEGDSFEMWDHSGEPVEVLLESGCPTVTIKTANHLMEELEKLRVAALKAGDPGDLVPNVWKWLKDLREMWPEVPDELIARVVPTGRWTAESAPLNRRQRQKIAASSSVVLHVFSGPDQSWWRKRLDSSSRTVICVDKMADSNQDLLADQLTSFLAEVCEKGLHFGRGVDQNVLLGRTCPTP